MEVVYKPDQSDLPSNTIVPDEQRWLLVFESPADARVALDKVYKAGQGQLDGRNLQMLDRFVGSVMRVKADKLEMVFMPMRSQVDMGLINGLEITNAAVLRLPKSKDWTRAMAMLKARCGRWPNSPEIIEARKNNEPVFVATELPLWVREALGAS